MVEVQLEVDGDHGVEAGEVAENMLSLMPLLYR